MFKSEEMRAEKTGRHRKVRLAKGENHAKSAIVAHDNLLNFQTKHHTGQWACFQVNQNNGHATDPIVMVQPQANLAYIGSETLGRLHFLQQ